jgi:DNA-binding Xre family transcriptional regulator
VKEDSMSKKLIALPEGNLMRVAAKKSITTLTELKDKTGVDRKTLRAIKEGKQVKETTLQSIADKLRVPLAHLVGADPATKREVTANGEYHYGKSHCSGSMAPHYASSLGPTR